MHSILSSYTVEPSFIYSNEPTISRYIHENHKAERVQTFSKFSVLIYNASLHFFASVVDHELSQKWYCKMINTWIWHYVSPFATNRTFFCDCEIHCSQFSRHGHLFSSKLLIEYSYFWSFMLMVYEVTGFSSYLCPMKQN